MSTYIRIRLAAFNDGNEPERPYAFAVQLNGDLIRRTFFPEAPGKMVGFVRNVKDTVIDIFWEELLPDEQRAVGLYPVLEDPQGKWQTIGSVVAAIEVAVSVSDGQTQTGTFGKKPPHA